MIRILMFFLLALVLNGQTKLEKQISDLYAMPKVSVDTTNNYSFRKHFQKLDITNRPKRTTNAFFYVPLRVGNYWEYVEQDTITMDGYINKSNFSVIREIVADTVFANNLSYKKIVRKNYANSVNYPEKYEYQRIDSLGNVHHCINNMDYLLYDFRKKKGETYPSCYGNKYWKVLDTYYFIGFGDTLLTFEFGLCDESGNVLLKETIVDKIGQVYYRGKLEDFSTFPQGDFWGGIINKKKYGDLLVKDSVNWEEYYPLQTGNFWKYSGNSGPIPEISTQKIIGDTVAGDGFTYKIIKYHNITMNEFSNSYTRLSLDGTVYTWDKYLNGNGAAFRSFKFSLCLGDTVHTGSSFIWRVESKYPYLQMRCYPDIIYHTKYFTKGIGLYSEVVELNSTYLVGSVINGQVNGDTILTEIEYNTNEAKKHLILQCYPNPFNSMSTIKVSLETNSNLQLTIYNILGEKIKSIVNEERPPGSYIFHWNGLNNENECMPSGTYIIRLESEMTQVSYLKTIMVK